MASYQIPQFLDSGDKIIGPLNMRQFGYLVGGGFTCYLIFIMTLSLVPGLKNYAIIPALPFVAVTLFLSFGRFNGRDSEIYLLKFILYNVKPKKMVYARLPDYSDLNAKLAELNFNKMYKKLLEGSSLVKRGQYNSYTALRRSQQSKADRIREIGETLDNTLINTLAEVKKKEVEIEAKQSLLDSLQ